MTRFRIETFCKFTGAPQAVEVVDSKQEVIIFCTSPWRSDSSHVVYSLTPGLPDSVYAIYVGGRCVSPRLNDMYPR